MARVIDVSLDFDEDTNLGFTTEEWITLNGFCKRIGLYSNGVLFVKPFSTQFYFDPDNDVIFLRSTCGRPEEVDIDTTVPDGYVKIQLGSKYYKLKLVGGGINDSTVGVYHEIVSLDNITGFYN